MNHDASTGISIGAFTTVGRYQVVVILSGLSENVPTDAAVVAAEAAKVMKAAAARRGDDRPAACRQRRWRHRCRRVPGFPTPSPTGTHA